MNDISRESREPVRTDEPGLQRAGRDGTAVCVGNGQLHQTNLGGVSGALNCMHDQQAVIVAATQQGGAEIRKDGISPTITAAAGMSGNNQPYMCATQTNPPRRYIVRRLTPLECCRLQGFPDWWEDGADGSDSARYRMWGNGIALPCAADVLGRIAKELRKEREQT